MAAGRRHAGFTLTAMTVALMAAVLPARADDAVKALAKSYSGFGARLFDTLARTPGNLMISPYSIGVAMSMAAAGARGDTSSELTRVLQLPGGDIGAADSRLAESLAAYGQRTEKPTTIKIANGLAIPAFGKDIVSKSFISLMQRDYSAEILADATVGGINDWVKQKTDGRIPSLVDSLPPTTTGVLLDAIAFEAKWESEFEKSNTKDLPFTLRSGQQVNTPRMAQTSYLRLVDGDGFQALQLPYATREIQFVAILPDKGKSVDAVLTALFKDETAPLLARLDGAPLRQVAVGLPKIDLRSHNGLRPAMEAAGIKLAFDPAHADFSGMIEPGAQKQRLSIDSVIHEAMIRVDEGGTIAAAATGVVTRSVSAMPVNKPPIPFVVDRPFGFLIVDRSSGAVLFEGRVDDPRG